MGYRNVLIISKILYSKSLEPKADSLISLRALRGSKLPMFYALCSLFLLMVADTSADRLHSWHKLLQHSGEFQHNQ